MCCDIVLDWRYLVGQTFRARGTASELRDELVRVVYDMHMAKDSCLETRWHEFLFGFAIGGILMSWSMKRSSEQCSCSCSRGHMC